MHMKGGVSVELKVTAGEGLSSGCIFIALSHFLLSLNASEVCDAVIISNIRNYLLMSIAGRS